MKNIKRTRPADGRAFGVFYPVYTHLEANSHVFCISNHGCPKQGTENAVSGND